MPQARMPRAARCTALPLPHLNRASTSSSPTPQGYDAVAKLFYAVAAVTALVYVGCAWVTLRFYQEGTYPHKKM